MLGHYHPFNIYNLHHLPPHQLPILPLHTQSITTPIHEIITKGLTKIQHKTSSQPHKTQTNSKLLHRHTIPQPPLPKLTHTLVNTHDHPPQTNQNNKIHTISFKPHQHIDNNKNTRTLHQTSNTTSRHSNKRTLTNIKNKQRNKHTNPKTAPYKQSPHHVKP